MSTDPQALARDLNNAGLKAMAAGDLASAQDQLQRAAAIAPGNPMIWLNVAAARRAASDVSGALAAVEEALKAKPGLYTALLMKGSLLERQGRKRRALSMYTAALKLAPALDSIDAATLQSLHYADQFSARYKTEFAEFLGGEINDLRARGSSAEARRIDTFINLSLGRIPRFVQEPTEYCYPGLPSIEFYEREEFPWLEGLESSTAAVRDELQQILQQDFRDFSPYINFADGVPADQWQELNHSARWSALHLYARGAPVEANCSRCPATIAALRDVPMASVAGRSPAALFSALQPGTHIPAHVGVANTRLIVHLPLIVPPGCMFRVGNEVRDWREGKAWVFDDTIEHEAWNKSDQTRVILICDIWNPRLNAAERELIQRVVAGMDRFDGGALDSDTSL